MPGEASLVAGEYYAFRHNQFWRIAGEIAGFAHDAPYARRTAALRRCRIALWDVRRKLCPCRQPRLGDPRGLHPRQRLRRLPRGAPGDPPGLLQRSQGGIGLASPRRADAPRDADARVSPAAVHEPGPCRDELSCQAQALAERDRVLNRRQLLQGLGIGALLRRPWRARDRGDGGSAGGARHRRGRRGTRRREGADGEGRLRARAGGARPHRRPRHHRQQPRRSLGPRLLLAACLERQPLDGLREAERFRGPARPLRARDLRRRAAHGRRRDRRLPRGHGADGARTRARRRPRPRHSRGSRAHAADARGSLVPDGDGRTDGLGGRRAREFLRARFPPVRRGRRGLHGPARTRDAGGALREGRGREARDAGHAHPLGRARRRRGHRSRPRHGARRRRRPAFRHRRRGLGDLLAAPAGRGAAGAPRPAARHPREGRAALQAQCVSRRSPRNSCA